MLKIYNEYQKHNLENTLFEYQIEIDTDDLIYYS